VLLAAAVCYGLLPFFPEELHRQILLMTPLLMSYAVFICVAVAFGGVLNSFRRFAVPALTPLILNLFLIVAAGGVWWTCIHGRSKAEIAAVVEKGAGVWWLVPAVLAAGAVHVWIHLRAARKAAGGEPFRFDPAVRSPEVRKVASLMAPALLGTGLIQLNIVLDTVWATVLGATALASLYFSQRIIYLPVGLFGVAAGVVSLPAMSQAWARDDRDAFRGQLGHSLRGVLFMSLPMTALLIVLAEPIVRLAYQRGSFGDESVRATLWALLFYLPGIPLFSLVKPMANGFYARQDTRTPVLVTLACLVLNVAMNLLVILPHLCPGSVFDVAPLRGMRQGGLALSTTLCSLANISALVWLFQRRTGMDILAEVRDAAVKILAATGIAALVAMLALRGVETLNAAGWLPATLKPGLRLLYERGLAVALPLAVGYAAYALAAWMLKCQELHELAGLVSSRLRRKKA
jgi:putative peptidoglycan lipid II flippase